MRFSGGGGSSMIFPWSPLAMPFSGGGGGGSSGLFPCPPKAGAIQWGGGSTITFPLMGPFYMFGPPAESATATGTCCHMIEVV